MAFHSIVLLAKALNLLRSQSTEYVPLYKVAGTNREGRWSITTNQTSKYASCIQSTALAVVIWVQALTVITALPASVYTSIAAEIQMEIHLVHLLRQETY